MASFCKLAVSRVGLSGSGHTEGGEVNVNRLDHGDKEIGSDDFIDVVPDKGPDRE